MQARRRKIKRKIKRRRIRDKKERPVRVYETSAGRRYIKYKGKRMYFKGDDTGLSTNELIRFIIQQFTDKKRKTAKRKTATKRKTTKTATGNVAPPTSTAYMIAVERDRNALQNELLNRSNKLERQMVVVDKAERASEKASVQLERALVVRDQHQIEMENIVEAVAGIDEAIENLNVTNIPVQNDQAAEITRKAKRGEREALENEKKALKSAAKARNEVNDLIAERERLIQARKKTEAGLLEANKVFAEKEEQVREADFELKTTRENMAKIVIEVNEARALNDRLNSDNKKLNRQIEEADLRIAGTEMLLQSRNAELEKVSEHLGTMHKRDNDTITALNKVNFEKWMGNFDQNKDFRPMVRLLVKDGSYNKKSKDEIYERIKDTDLFKNLDAEFKRTGETTTKKKYIPLVIIEPIATGATSTKKPKADEPVPISTKKPKADKPVPISTKKPKADKPEKTMASDDEHVTTLSEDEADAEPVATMTEAEMMKELKELVEDMNTRKGKQKFGKALGIDLKQHARHDELITMLNKEWFGDMKDSVEMLDDQIENVKDTESTIVQGDGKKSMGSGGLYNVQIAKMMNKYPKFVGVFASDELSRVPKNRNVFGFIMNTKPRKVATGGHWVAVYIDTEKDMTIEYYDSFADSPRKQFLKDIKKVIDALKTNVYLKFKVNKIEEQNVRTQNCGWFAMRFLMNRFKGTPFKDITGYSDTVKGEKKVKKMKEEFGYI